MMAPEPFAAIATQANAVPMDEERLHRHLALIADINVAVARTALEQLTLAASPWSLATLRAQALADHASDGGTGDAA